MSNTAAYNSSCIQNPYDAGHDAYTGADPKLNLSVQDDEQKKIPDRVYSKKPISAGVTNPEISCVSDGSELNQMLDFMQLPNTEIMPFDWDPLRYYLFIRSFDNAVGRTSVDDNAKLNRLLQYCKGKALSVIECCAMMEPCGYRMARAQLEERFGSKFVISEAWIGKVTDDPGIKSNDHKAL
jgi:hypothetical protein